MDSKSDRVAAMLFRLGIHCRMGINDNYCYYCERGFSGKHPENCSGLDTMKKLVDGLRGLGLEPRVVEAQLQEKLGRPFTFHYNAKAQGVYLGAEVFVEVVAGLLP